LPYLESWLHLSGHYW